MWSAWYQDKETIRLAPASKLLTIAFWVALARRIKALGLSREKTTNWMLDRLYSWNGTILDEHGDEIVLHDEIADEAYGHEPGFRWNWSVKKFAIRPPKRLPAKKLLLRFQLWAAAFLIAGDPIGIPEEH